MKTSIFRVALFSLFISGFFIVSAQNASVEDKKNALSEEKAALPKPYNPKEDAEKKLKTLTQKAEKENKKILVQVGGNWCIWCLRFHQFVQQTPDLKNIVDKHYLYYHLNHSPENKNEKILKSLGNPEKYGFPVLVVLDRKGKLIHTQDTSVLEEGKGYSLEKVKDFFTKFK